jgi:CheY-like chemotaxis protein/HPt (histidine-containing phosphotransfer) domain-containing protein
VNNTLGNIKVLLAEDNEVNKLLARSILQHWGIESKTAHTGYEAVALLQDEDFDIVLMDIQMPERNGIEATQDIRNLTDEKKKNVPIIALTANALRGEEKKYLAAGMNDYLTKPFKEKELYEVIQRVLAKQNAFGSRYQSYSNGQDVDLPPAGEKLYDLALVDDLAQGNAEFIKSLVQIFIDTVPSTAKEMAETCEQRDWEQTGKLAHKLKSTIDTMQIVSAKDDIRTIEMSGKNGQQIDALPYLVKRINLIIERATEQLKEEFSL